MLKLSFYLYGLITAGWEIKNKTFVYTVTIPSNTIGTFILPTSEVAKIMINASPISIELKKNVITTATATKLELGSGRYELSCPII